MKTVGGDDEFCSTQNHSCLNSDAPSRVHAHNLHRDAKCTSAVRLEAGASLGMRVVTAGAAHLKSSPGRHSTCERCHRCVKAISRLVSVGAVRACGNHNQIWRVTCGGPVPKLCDDAICLHNIGMSIGTCSMERTTCVVHCQKHCMSLLVQQLDQGMLGAAHKSMTLNATS
jgi:hypothetical protein